jgi:hypothetical protein
VAGESASDGDIVEAFRVNEIILALSSRRRVPDTDPGEGPGIPPPWVSDSVVTPPRVAGSPSTVFDDERPSGSLPPP